MKVIFHVEGGLGKHIMSTAILKVISKKYPKNKIHVVCSYPDVFKHNPLVEDVTINGQQGPFYKTYIRGKEDKINVYASLQSQYESLTA